MSQTATERRIHFDAIVAKAEKHHHNNPKGYKSKLKRLAWLGYGYLFFILLLCLVFLGGLVFMTIKSPVFLILLVKSKLIIAVLLVAYVMFKSLFIKIPSPEGYRLTKSQAPKLFEAINKLRSQLKTPRIHEVLITPELNAAIQQSPRLGVFGWQKNSLILGSELLMVLNEREVLAVIAHEMGHLSGGHSKFNGWIYRVRIGWMNILYTVAHINAVAKWVFGKFFGWYAPYFNAYSFTLARANEYEADRIAAESTSADDLSSALVGTEVMSQLFFADYWQQLEKQAMEDPVLKATAYTQLQQAIEKFELSAEKIQNQVNKALKIKTTNDNTHPALKDRVEAIGGRTTFDFNPNKAAAKTWFGSSFADIMTNLANNWVSWNQAHWEELHAQGKQAKIRLDEINNKDNLSTEELVEKAHIQLFLEGQKSALPTFKVIYQQDPNEPSALYYLGTALLDRDNSKGLNLLNKLLSHDEYGQTAGQRLYAYYEANDMPTEADEVLLKIEKNIDAEELFFNELAEIKATDKFYVLDLSAVDRDKLKASLKKYPAIKHIWVAGRRLKTRPDCQVCILLFELHEGEDEYEVFANQDQPFDVEGYYSLVNTENKKLSKEIRPHCVQIR